MIGRKDNETHPEAIPAKAIRILAIDFEDLFPPSIRDPTASNEVEFIFPRLPLPVPLENIRYAATTLDSRGRVGNRSVIRSLGWAPTHRLQISVTDHLAVVRSSPQGRWSISSRGYLHLPATIQRAFGVDNQSQILLVAAPQLNTIVIYSAAALANTLWKQHPSIWERL